ncbi:MAG: hypothetical protein EB168_08975 [Euryarchaeota archaeon]|nr:hypothetical protein [Euryarchaeota archaeon]
MIRLAATTDEEGIANLARYIVVRYVSSAVSTTQVTPLTLEREMTFEITLASQSYLTQSGHDYVTQMCAGAYNTLTNTVPTNTGSQIVIPLSMKSESFDGLTDSSHYVYTQQWTLGVREMNPTISMHPCVAWGNCSFLFPNDTLSPIGPGDVIEGNEIWSPADPEQPGLCGVEPRGNDLVYKSDETRVFIKEWENYVLKSTGTYTEDGRYLIVNLYSRDGEFIRIVLYSNCDGRKVIQIGGFQPGADGNWLCGLWRSPIDQVGNPSTSGGPEVFPQQILRKNGYGYVVVGTATVFTDPTNPEAPVGLVKYGSMYATHEGVELTNDGISYYYIGGTPVGKGWIRQSDFSLINNPVSPINCEEPEIIDGFPEGDYEGTGPIDSCE